MTSRKNLIIIAVVLVVLGGLGFIYKQFVVNRISSNIVEQAIEKDTHGQADVDLAGDAQWPATMPSDVPQFPKGSILMAVSSSENAATTWSVLIKDVTPADVAAYQTQLSNTGWQSDQEISAVVTMHQYKKANLTLTLAYDASSSGVQLVVLKD